MQINVANTVNVEDFKFEIHYNITLLDYVNVTWNAWPHSGIITVDEANGNLTGYTSGSSITGNATLITIEFHAAYHHIWKDCAGWTKDLTGTIYFQWANLSYPSGPDLRYEKDGPDQINVTQVDYTLSPIQGDINNDGDVDIFDLRAVAAFYNVEKEACDVNCEHHRHLRPRNHSSTIRHRIRLLT